MTGPPVWTWKVSIKVQTLCFFILWILSWRDKSSCHLWCRCGEAAAGAVKESGSASCSLAGCDQTKRVGVWEFECVMDACIYYYGLVVVLACRSMVLRSVGQIT